MHHILAVIRLNCLQVRRRFYHLTVERRPTEKEQFHVQTILRAVLVQRVAYKTIHR